jgi:hypothetical protein
MFRVLFTTSPSIFTAAANSLTSVGVVITTPQSVVLGPEQVEG